MRILMILLPDGGAGDADGPSLLTLDAIARSYYVLADFGAEVVMASPTGGFVPVDRTELEGATTPSALLRFKGDRGAREALGDTVAIEDVYIDDFEAALCMGPVAGDRGRAPPDALATLISAFAAAGKPVSMVLPSRQAGSREMALHVTGVGARTPELAATILLDSIGGDDRQPRSD